MADTFAYDAVDYPTAVIAETHPGHLYAVGRMYGVNAAPIERCRMLEVGCGDGWNLIACAMGLPNATFAGVDLSAKAIARGNAAIAELGLTNVTLHATDLADWEPPAEPFDYALAHGFYSWVPANVRDALLSLYKRVLAPTGIGYVSYNIYPGCYIRRMFWEMLNYHARSEDPATRIREAHEMAEFLREGQPEKSDARSEMLKLEIEEIRDKRHPAVLYHDDIAAINDPVYFHEFVAHAGRFGLRFVAEAEAHTMEAGSVAKPSADILAGMAAHDVLRKEQYLDFVKLRRFRMTLLAPDGCEPRNEPDAAQVGMLAISSRAKADPSPVDLSPGVAVTFSAGDAIGRTDKPAGKAALTALAEIWPRRLWFADLLLRVEAKLGKPLTPEEATSIADLLGAAWRIGLCELHGHVPTYESKASERPKACPFARLQVRSGTMATSRNHALMKFDDAPSRRLIELLDGTRTREQIADGMVDAFPPGQRPDRLAILAGLENHLASMARQGLLIA